MKNFGLFQFILASTLAMFVTFPGQQINLPAADLEAGKTTFDKFLEKFPQADLPYTVGIEPIVEHDLEAITPNDPDEALLLGEEFSMILPALEHRRFSRMGPDDFYAEAILASTDDFHILLYQKKHPFSFYAGTHILAVMSRSGKLLDEMTFAYTYGREGGIAGTIDENFIVEIAEKESVWAKDVREYGYEDNEITGYKTISSEFFSINKNGKFEEMEIRKAEPVSVVNESNAE